MKYGKKKRTVVCTDCSSFSLRGAVPSLSSPAVGLLAATEQQQLGSSAVAQAVSMGTVPKDLLQGGDAPGWPVCFLATCSIQFEKSFEVDGWKVLNKIDAPLSRENDDMEIGWESRKCVG